MFNFVRNKWAQAGAATATLLATASAHAQATGFESIIDAVDLSSVSAKVVAAALIVVGIAMVFKGPDVSKRIIRKV